MILMNVDMGLINVILLLIAQILKVHMRRVFDLVPATSLSDIAGLVFFGMKSFV